VPCLAQPFSNLVPTLVLVPLVGFMLYRRLRRTFGRQPVTPWRMILRIVLLSAICVVLLASSSLSSALVAASGGLALGVVLALVGLRHTSFEVTAAGRFYTPNKWLGLVVTALLLGRLAARLLAISEGASQVAPGTSPLAGVQRSPLTIGLFFLLAGYYVPYYVGVLRKAGQAVAAPSAAPGPSGAGG
jgi:hypothetical protein